MAEQRIDKALDVVFDSHPPHCKRKDSMFNDIPLFGAVALLAGPLAVCLLVWHLTRKERKERIEKARSAHDEYMTARYLAATAVERGEP